MNDKRANYNEAIKQKILKYPACHFKSIEEIKDLGTFPFSPNKLSEVRAALLSGGALSNIDAGFQAGFREYLDVLKITDESGSQHYVLIYDSDELWQDPVVIELLKSKL